jgi:hypothetical protein
VQLREHVPQARMPLQKSDDVRGNACSGPKVPLSDPKRGLQLREHEPQARMLLQKSDDMSVWPVFRCARRQRVAACRTRPHCQDAGLRSRASRHHAVSGEVEEEILFFLLSLSACDALALVPSLSTSRGRADHISCLLICVLAFQQRRCIEQEAEGLEILRPVFVSHTCGQSVIQIIIYFQIGLVSACPCPFCCAFHGAKVSRRGWLAFALLGLL